MLRPVLFGMAISDFLVRKHARHKGFVFNELMYPAHFNYIDSNIHSGTIHMLNLTYSLDTDGTVSEMG